MPKWDYSNEKCKACDNTIKEKDIYPYCSKCRKILVMPELSFIDYKLLGKKARLLKEAYNKDILTKECFVKKRDRLLLLRERAEDKYLTKLKKEVDRI